MSSGEDPMFMDNQSYRTSMNTLNRGGVVRTRPGYKKVFDLPAGNLQGLSYFKPFDSEAYLTFAIDGVVYASQFPFQSFAPLSGIQFYKYAKNVFFCQTVQGAVLNTDGSVSVQDPVRVLVMQDGQYTRSAFWNGQSSGHLDPSVPATFQSVIDTSGAVISTAVTYGGTGYSTSSPPTITFAAPSETAGIAFRTATGHVVVDAGQIQEVIMDDVGAGYTFAPAVSVSGQKLGPPLGGPMAWSGQRLWVAQDNKVLPSDISNPLGFSEVLFATGGGYFMFQEPVTALAEIPSFQDPNLAVFSRNTSSILQSSNTDRSTWQSTADFQSVMFPGVGCVGHKAITSLFGEMWWMADAGFTNFNAAEQSKITSYIVPQDTAMAVSKFNLSADLSGCAAAQYENFLLLSVPYADVYNRHTWVYDQAVTSGVAQSIISGPYQGATSAWASYWTGTRPVQWASGAFNGVVRIFHVSVDYDGVNRLWEAFDPDRTDNGSPITCFLETKTHGDYGSLTGQLFDLKKFMFAEVNLTDVLGPVQLSVNWAGTRGKFKNLEDYTLTSTEGSVKINVPLGTLETYRSQVRRLRTVDALLPTPTQIASGTACTAANTENNIPGVLDDQRDIGFSLLMQWEGQMAIRSYRIFCDISQEPSHGAAPMYEYDPRVLEGAFCL
jgi:hypothetical protein